MFDVSDMNEAQRAAVLHGEGPLLVLAGPGSGKTFTITRRILYLIKERLVRPEEILVITFTKDAALSMQQRFQSQSDRNYPVNFGTFHAVFYQILRQSQQLQQITLLNRQQKRNLILPVLQPYFVQCEDNGRLQLAEEAAAVLDAISFYKNTEEEQAAADKLPAWITGGRETGRTKIFAAIFRGYENARKHLRALDFDDMVYECRELLRREETIRRRWQARFSHILIDEFQDINPMQYQVVQLLTKAPCNLFAVGDDDQAIYGFRGSKPACLQRFLEEYKANQVLLNINYRSHSDIISASLAVIGENKQRFAKRLIACEAWENKRAKLGKAISGVIRLRCYPERVQEAEALREKLIQREQNKITAVLFRTNSQMQAFAAYLKKAGVSFGMKEKGNSIYEHFVVKDILAYLKLAHQEDRALLLQIINKPSRYLHREAFGSAQENTLAALEHFYREYYDKGYGRRALAELARLRNDLAALRGMKPSLGIVYICKKIGYERYLRKLAGRSTDKWNEWQELLQWLKEDTADYQTFAEWQDAIEAYGECVSRDRGDARTDSTLQLMTVHASKGLEFDTVYLPGCNEKTYPHGAMVDAAACEEERRIFYVAMTRAKETLELSCLTGTRERPRVMSRFLNPLLESGIIRLR